MQGKSGGSLTFPDNPLASMQELSALDAPAPPAVSTPRPEPETIKERNNEGNFITSEFPTKETPSETPKQSKSEPKKQSNSQALEQSRKASPKQSLKEAVLEDGKAPEEKVTKTRLNVDIDEELHIWLKGHAIQNRRKLNDLIPRILKAYRDQVEGD